MFSGYFVVEKPTLSPSLKNKHVKYLVVKPTLVTIMHSNNKLLLFDYSSFLHNISYTGFFITNTGLKSFKEENNW